jgi:hypothetical protein
MDIVVDPAVPLNTEENDQQKPKKEVFIDIFKIAGP